MSSVSETFGSTRENVAAAVRHDGRALSLRAAQDWLFARLFSGLVYAQIWEDPVIDMEALAIRPSDHIVAIASGGCNVMSYLAANPARITAIDLNAHHVALNRLKLAAAMHLPDYRTFRRFLSGAKGRDLIALYDAHLSSRLDRASRDHFAKRDGFGRRRIAIFARGLYRQGLLGRFIGLGHLVARLHRVNPRSILRATSIEEQKAIFDRDLKPVITSRFVRFFAKSPATLYGLGIPPHQYRSLLTSAPPGGDMADVLADRLEQLACGFPLSQNYFARQAFDRRYDPAEAGSVPPGLEAVHFEAVRARASRVDVRQENLIDHLAGLPAASRDCYVLLDAQDWMDDTTLNRLWREILRTASPGARVIFRTAAEPSLLPGRLDETILSRFAYDEARCKEMTKRDRSAVYGGFHLYTLKD